MIYKDASLKALNTFGLDYKADTLISVDSEEELIRIIRTGKIKEPVMILGGGSNLLFISDFKGTLVHPVIHGISEEEKDNDHVTVAVAAGVKWDSVVEWAVSQGYGGAENLSLIPGNIGATPVQNIGAYGVEVRDIIHKVRAVSLETGDLREFSPEECRFGYRESIFKGALKNRYLITKVWFRLSSKPEFRTDYGSLHTEIEKMGPISLRTIREAVIKIRNSKLPDPAITGNAGSFFKNPVVEKGVSDRLRIKYQRLPAYEDPSGGIKLSAGWLIEQCGWKGKRHGDAGVYGKQALVIVNYGKATGKEIFDLSELIRKSVFEKFGIDLQREVEVVGEINQP